MSSNKHVQKLSASKQRLSLGEVKKQEKAKSSASTNKFVRTTVLNPHYDQWPDIDEQDEKLLLSQLKSDLKCLQTPKVHIPLKEIKEVEKSKRREFRRKYQAERIDDSTYSTFRKDVALGVNAVSREMDIGGLIAVVVEKNPITRLLVRPGVATPIVAIDGLNDACRDTFKTRCSALGFRTNCQNSNHKFNQIYSTIVSICAKRKSHSQDLIPPKIRKV